MNTAVSKHDVEAVVGPLDDKQTAIAGEWGWVSVPAGTGGHVEDKIVLGHKGVLVSGPMNQIHWKGNILQPWSVRRSLFLGREVEFCFRLYDVNGCTVEDTAVLGMGDWVSAAGKGWDVEGHAFYLNLYGGANTFDNVLIEGCAAQAFQLVNRPSEGLVWSGDGYVSLKRVWIQDCAKHENRGAHPLSLYNFGGEIYIDTVGIYYTDDFPEFIGKASLGYPVYNSRGALYCGPGQVSTARCPLFEARDLFISVNSPDRGSVFFRNQDMIEWTGGLVEDRSGAPGLILLGPGCDRGEITNIDGPVHICSADSSGRILEVLSTSGSYTWDNR